MHVAAPMHFSRRIRISISSFFTTWTLPDSSINILSFTLLRAREHEKIEKVITCPEYHKNNLPSKVPLGTIEIRRRCSAQLALQLPGPQQTSQKGEAVRDMGKENVIQGMPYDRKRALITIDIRCGLGKRHYIEAPQSGIPEKKCSIKERRTGSYAYKQEKERGNEILPPKRCRRIFLGKESPMQTIAAHLLHMPPQAFPTMVIHDKRRVIQNLSLEFFDNIETQLRVFSRPKFTIEPADSSKCLFAHREIDARPVINQALPPYRHIPLRRTA